MTVHEQSAVSAMPSVPPTTARDLLQDFSLEMTGKDVSHLLASRAEIPSGTRINVTFLGSERAELRIEAARAVRDCGLVPVPHISARRLRSEGELVSMLRALDRDDAAREVFAVGGDPAAPAGPYDSALALIESGFLQSHGVKKVSIAGYPEGHPGISDAVLWHALEAKAAVLRAHGLDGAIITQFGFDADRVLRWLESVRGRGIDLPVRVGVPGPTSIRRLLGYASRFGVGTSASIAKKYGLSLTNLIGTAGPDSFLAELAAGYEPARHGDMRVHFYTFGGIGATTSWIADLLARSAR